LEIVEVAADHQRKVMVEEQQELVDQKVLVAAVMLVLMDPLVLEEEVLTEFIFKIQFQGRISSQPEEEQEAAVEV
tara:strand:- start:376 stop:600 length:225 start_codon:yes stop_codon:yes gene_type:complete